MPINHSLKTIFVHIPKTAGTSVEDALGMLPNKSIGFSINQNISADYTVLFGQGLQHLKAYDIKRRVGAELFKSYYKFSIVRNPYERLVSYVAWLNGKWEKQESLSRQEFSEYLKKRFLFGKINIRKIPTPQYNYLFFNKRLLVDDIFYFENLEEDFSSLQKRFGFKEKLSKRMCSCHADYQSYFNKEERNIITRYYALDFKYFGYAT